jgi:hypothetical protein
VGNPAVTKSEDAQAAAGVLLPLIRRVSPGALEKAEMVDNSGLDTDEIREGVDCLVAEGKIEETDDGYILAGREAEAAASATKTRAKEASGEEGEGSGGPDPAAPPSVPGSLNSYRATMETVITYGGSEEGDEEAMAKAAAMEEEIADLIHQQYPNSVVAVEVKKVEAYKPRVIFVEGGE